MVTDTPENAQQLRAIAASSNTAKTDGYMRLTPSPECVGAKHAVGFLWSRNEHLILEDGPEVFLDPVRMGCLGTRAERRWRISRGPRSYRQVTSNQSLTLRVPESVGLGGAREFSFLTYSQVTLILPALVHSTHFENH